MCRTRFYQIAGGIMMVLSGMGSAWGDVYPITSWGGAKASANTFPNPIEPFDQDSFLESTGDFEVNAYQMDTTEPSSPYIRCEVTAGSSCHVDESGASGSARLETHWVGVNTDGVPNQQSGTFGSETFYRYSFLTDTPGTITIEVTTSSNLGNIIPLDPEEIVNYATAINHVVTFDDQYTELWLNDQRTLVFDIPPGFYELILEHHPNSGIMPWPTCDVTTTSEVTFTIETESVEIVRGDMDCDGDLDLDDIPAMVFALLNPGLHAELYGCTQNGDMTADEFIDGADLQGFVEALLE